MALAGCQLKVHDFSHLYCINETCSHYQVKGKGNIKLVGHFGANKQHHQVYCTLCKKSMSEKYGTPYYHSPLSPEEVRRILLCLREGNGIRGTARITGHGKDTVMRVIARVGSHSKAVTEEMLRGLNLTEVQMDEFWTFIKKNRKTLPKRSSLKANAEMPGFT